MHNLFNLKNKKILVTGASSGIGREISIQCSNMGAQVFITGRNVDKLKETLSFLNETCSYFECDICNEVEVKHLVEKIPSLDGVVFSAGVIDYMPIKFLTLKKINDLMNINFNSQVFLTQQLLKNNKLNNSSSILYVSSIASKIGIAGTSIYSASKAALNAFSRVLASELANKKIRVNTLCPGIVKTPMGNKAIESNPEVENDYPLGLGVPEDVAYAAIYFLSDMSRWVTGNEFIIDGGLTLK